MSDTPNKEAFIVNERPGEYTASFSVSGTVTISIKAADQAEAIAKALAMAEDEEFGFEIDDVSGVHLDHVYKDPPMYLVDRDGRKMQTSRLMPGDLPRQPDERGF